MKKKRTLAFKRRNKGSYLAKFSRIGTLPFSDFTFSAFANSGFGWRTKITLGNKTKKKINQVTPEKNINMPVKKTQLI